MKLHQTATPVAEVFHLENCRAIDGDTMEATIFLGFDVMTRQRIRLKGFFAPELDGQQPDCGLAAKELLQQALNASQVCMLKRGARKDVHGRWVSMILFDGKPADPFLVIYPYQLTEQAHAQDLKIQKLKKAGKRGVL